MPAISTKITDDIVKIAERKLKELGKDKYVAVKFQAVISAKKHGITKVAEVFNISRQTLYLWITHVKEEHLGRPIGALGCGRGRKKKLKPEQVNIVQEWLKENSQLKIDHVKFRILQEFNIPLSRSSVYRIIQSTY